MFLLPENVMTRFVLSVCAMALLVCPRASDAQSSHTYKVLATSKTSTMQKEMQEAGAAGYRFVAVMGGETAMGGKEVVVLLEKRADDEATYAYRLLATNRTGTLQKELQEAADAGYVAVGQTVFESLFGGKETASILQRAGSAPTSQRYDYRLIATSRTSTLQKELQQAAEQGYEAIGMTVGHTALGGAELVVITRRSIP
jgi:hypothetical protein